MTIIATLIDQDRDYFGHDHEFESDDGFDVVEQIAKSHAAVGRKCAIQWAREEDGQVAYWGPSGASLKPQWYS